MSQISNELKEFNLKIVEKISKGFSSEIFLVKSTKTNNFFALKLEKTKSPRVNMVLKESSNLLLANSVGIGPMLFAFDKENRFVLMEFIQGKTFNRWLEQKNLKKTILKNFLKNLLLQSQKLDSIGLDHGQLGGKGKNILVKKNLPLIIDFEKSSPNRKVHNVSQIKSLIYYNKNSFIAKRIKKLLGETEIEKLIASV